MYFPTLKSTNSYALAHPEVFVENSITVIDAANQTAGHGRKGDLWLAGDEKNITVSFTFLLPKEMEWQWVGLILAAAAYELLTSLQLEVYFKWPNDLFVSHKKIAGILVETKDINQKLGIVAGIGLNINALTSDLKQVSQSATSVFIETGIEHEVKALIGRLAQSFEKRLTRYLSEGLDAILPEINGLKRL